MASGALLDPRTSIWVEASAGTGKTKLLIDRILALILRGQDMSHILCLTFTRAAAFEMEERLETTLESWRDAAPEQQQEILLRFGIKGSINFLDIYQKHLFGPKAQIMTIHSFCEKILRLIPQSSCLKHDFSLLTEYEQSLMFEQAYFEIIKIYPRYKVNQLFKTFSAPQIKKAIFKSRPHINKENFQSQILEGEASNSLGNANELLDKITTLDEVAAITLKSYFETPEDENTFIARFCTKSGTLKARPWLKKNHPEAGQLNAVWKELTPVINALHNKLNAILQLKLNKEFWPFAQIFHKKLTELKQADNKADFDDLIEGAAELLKSDDYGPQISMRLDHKIDHILVDEAQDTNPKQWAVILELMSSFLQSSESDKSLFVVGDGKQSIYGFQGADFEFFKSVKNHIASTLSKFETMTLKKSFRSLPSILECVDKVFTGTPLGSPDINERLHLPHRDKSSGTVELLNWQKNHTPDERIKRKPWVVAPLEQSEEATIWMTCLCDHLKIILSDKAPLDATGQQVEADDIILLMRNRASFIPTLLKTLKEHNIPCAGIDKIVLKEAPLTKELLHLLNFILLPDDDASLANVLLSSLIQNKFKFTPKLLHDLAFEREESLWNRLQEHHSNIFNWLTEIKEKCLDKNLSNSIIYLLNILLNVSSTTENQDLANTIIDEAYQFTQANHNPSLQIFINYLLDMEKGVSRQTGSGVRIMTVHGAKGLQAPIVYVIDNDDEASIHKDTFLKTPNHSLLSVKKTYDTVMTSALKTYHQQNLKAENMRLLYVALTRAQDQLYLISTKLEPKEKSWFEQVKKSQHKQAA